MSININVYLNTLRQKGYLAYEYNPFHNYQTNVDLYQVDNKYIVPYDQAVNLSNGELLTKKTIGSDTIWVDQRGNSISNYKTAQQGELWAKAGSVIDFETDKLNFDLEHPVDIQVQPSYDGSVNLILNDNKNIPRLINSRFSVREKNTYEIVDRIGENDTNIYNSDSFDKDTSLYFQYEYNPIITFNSFVKGILPVGQYCFYFTYCDSDNNESDYIAETGLIPAFIGSDCFPASMDGGIKNQLSYKGIKLKLTNLDKSYNYLKIYYVRYFADYQQNRVYEAKEIIKKYPINSSTLFIQITGNEETDDIDANQLNISRFNPKSVLTQAQCKNMLFFGNIVKNTDNYKELTDCALRIFPELTTTSLDIMDNDYSGTGYYSTQNIYTKVGYFNEEYYRFGVVFIYQNGTLSNVYNTLGGELNNDSNNQLFINGKLFKKEDSSIILTRQYIKTDENGWVKSSSSYDLSGKDINGKGVCHFNLDSVSEDSVLGVKFNIPQEVIDYLKTDLGIRGMFFVRQKCVPNILAQCYLMPMDEQLEAPVIETVCGGDTEYFTECFLSQSNSYIVDKNSEATEVGTNEPRLVVNEYNKRLYKYKYSDRSSADCSLSKKAYAGICPDFLLNQAYYNQIFNGNSFKLKKISSAKLSSTTSRFYKTDEDLVQSSKGGISTATINTVTEDLPTVAIEDKIYRLEIGKTEESYRFQYCEVDSGTYSAGGDNNINEATNLVRGKYSPYLAIYCDSSLETGALYNIYQDNSQDIQQEYQNRMDSSEAFYAISDRYNFNILSTETKSGITVRPVICYRGDCYINTFTYRLNRNFNDPSLANNDTIVDSYTWRNSYDVNDSGKWPNIYRSDLNAVQMGSWITFKVRSAMNYALRSQDHSYTSEEALMGAPRSFYPRDKMMWKGENKLPDSYLYNDAYRASLGFKCYFTLNDINYIKDTFSNRIQYSAVSIQDSFKNNYRISYSTYFRDYSTEYGSITKLMNYNGYLLVVFEHAIGLLAINERILAGNGDGEPVFINTQNVLPEEVTIISDTIGSQWPESIIKSEQGYVYGVDTIAKKLWRVGGQTIQILSDLKMNKFLIDNISLGERDLYPKIGIRNVKTHYNNNKKDIMFTFYDDAYTNEEKAWNLCYNEILEQFITFYSWIPSYSENIDTQFFTFDRNTSKELALLAKCNAAIPENSGILLENPVLNIDEEVTYYYSTNIYYSINESVTYTTLNDDGTTTSKTMENETDLNNGQAVVPYNKIYFELEKDPWGNYNNVEIRAATVTSTGLVPAKLCLTFGYKIDAASIEACQEYFKKNKVMLLYVSPYYITYDQDSNGTRVYLNTETVAVTIDKVINNQYLTDDDKIYPAFHTDFYLHGQAGIFDVKEDLRPTYWYGEQHPFEFEVIVNDNIGMQKIFTNLVIISNKAEPESFHFEIEGDNYEFSMDKKNMYFRQEATKNLYQNLGSDMLYDRNYTDCIASMYSKQQYYRGGTEYTNQYSKFDKVYPVMSEGLVQQQKSTIFPLYYEKVDTYNDIYHKYVQMTSTSEYDFRNLSGSEIAWNKDLNQFDIITHIKNNPVDLVGRLRGNSRYKEGKWNIQIPSINFMQKNEYDTRGNSTWVAPYSDLNISSNITMPPLVINSSNIPANISNTITPSVLPNIYYNKDNTNWYKAIDTSGWTSRKETKIRDKWMKVRVIYSGENLAVIHSLITLYNKSYS